MTPSEHIINLRRDLFSVASQVKKLTQQRRMTLEAAIILNEMLISVSHSLERLKFNNLRVGEDEASPPRRLAN